VRAQNRRDNLGDRTEMMDSRRLPGSPENDCQTVKRINKINGTATNNKKTTANGKPTDVRD